jgi:hypothetical protein
LCRSITTVSLFPWLSPKLPIFSFAGIGAVQVFLLTRTRLLWGYYLRLRRGLEPLRRGAAGEECGERECEGQSHQCTRCPLAAC